MAKPLKADKRTNTYVDIAFRLLQEQPGVKDVIILNSAANPIRTTMKQDAAVEYCGYYEMLNQKAHYTLQQLDPEDELLGLRVRTNYDETIIMEDGKITAIVVQSASDMVQEAIKKIDDPEV